MEAVTAPLQSYISSTSAAVIGAITPVATTLLMIYIMFWGWSMIRGVITEPVTDGVTRIVKLAVICAIALSVGFYSQFLVDWLWQRHLFPTEIAKPPYDFLTTEGSIR